MPVEITLNGNEVLLTLKGSATARYAGQFKSTIASNAGSASHVIVCTDELEDIDTTILQLLISIKKTVARLTVEKPSAAFLDALDRAALRRELLTSGKESI